MARTFLARGYAVDVIDFENSRFVPKKKYSYVIDVGENLERFSKLLNKECMKIFHITTTHWSFNNTAEKKRLKDLERRRGVLLDTERLLPESRSAEEADILLLLLGNDFTEGTYTHLQKPIFRIPISTTFTYPSPESKDFDSTRKSFVWIGGAGLVHKGVDLLLEAFAEMPSYELHVCGKLNDEAFKKVYEKELALPHIHLHGVLNLGGKDFPTIANRSIAVISPSCAEGQSGAVIVGMHAGLIPIVSKESGIDTDGFGITMSSTTIDNIKTQVRILADMDPNILRDRAIQSWKYAQSRHTRKLFLEKFSSFVDELESRYPVIL